MILTKIKNIFLTIKNKFSSPEVIFFIGLPGSGKKHYADMMRNDSNYKKYKFLSIDHSIEVMAQIKNKTYDEIFDEELPEIEEFFILHLETAIKKRESVIINNHSNISKDNRAKILNLIPDTYHKKAIVFYASMEEMKNRIAHRKEHNIKSASEDIIDSLVFNYQHPDKLEFDEIIKA